MVLENQQVFHNGKTYIVKVYEKENGFYAVIENNEYEVFVYSPVAWSTTDYNA